MMMTSIGGETRGCTDSCSKCQLSWVSEVERFWRFWFGGLGLRVSGGFGRV